MPELSSMQLEGVRIAVHALSMLSPARTVSTTEIHQRLLALGFSRVPRSTQRLMEQLCAEFQVERDTRTKPYGYRLKANAASLGRPRLDDSEALVLLLARQHLEPLLPANVMQAVDPLFDEARRKLDPYHGTRQLRTWPRKVAVVSQLQPLMPPRLEAGVLDQVTEALNADHWLVIDYRNFAGEMRESRRVMPLALVQQGVRLLLVCQFEGYEDRRHLALHRIHRAASSGLPFERPEFDLEAYIRDGRFGFGNGERIVLRLELDKAIAELLAETPVSADQHIQRRVDGTIELSATVVRSDQLRWWIRTYGNAVRVLAPAGLLDEPSPSQRPVAPAPAFAPAPFAAKTSRRRPADA